MNGKLLAAHIVTMYRELRENEVLKKPLTRNRLYRLFFLIQLDYFQQTSDFLIHDTFVHFKLGPVELDVYRAYNLYSFDEEIKTATKEMIFKDGRFSYVDLLEKEPTIEDWIKTRIINIFKTFDSLTDYELVDYTHDIIKVKERGTLLNEIDYIFAKRKVLI